MGGNLYGIQAITMHNGWSIAIVGVSIVFSGLVILSIMISRIHIILNAWENRSDLVDFVRKVKRFKKKTAFVPASCDVAYDYDRQASMEQCELLVTSMGKFSFALPRLLELAEKRGVARPHDTICHLVKQKIIIPDGKGFYNWVSSVSRKN
jgi:hypothetical protein